MARDCLTNGICLEFSAPVFKLAFSQCCVLHVRRRQQKAQALRHSFQYDGKPADANRSVIINDRAFRAHAAERRASPAQVGKVRRRLLIGFDSARRAQKMSKLDERRGCPAFFIEQKAGIVAAYVDKGAKRTAEA